MDVERLRFLLNEALAVLDGKTALPTQPEAEQFPAEETIRGKVGRPEFKDRKEIALWDAGLKITNGDGEPEWINIQAWRKTAVFARDNLPSAAETNAVGRWKTEEWVGNDGVERSREVFVVTHFKPAYVAD